MWTLSTYVSRNVREEKFGKRQAKGLGTGRHTYYHDLTQSFRNSRKLVYIHWFLNPYPTAFPYGNGMVLHFYQQQESSTTKTVNKVINKGLKTYV